MSTSWEEYQFDFLKMISELAEDFTRVQCKKLSYIYQNQFTSSFQDQYANDPLKLLDYLLKERKFFSFDKPENLATMMETLGFLDKKERVELFIGNHKKKLSSLSVRGRALPPTPEPIQEEAESPYVSIHQVPDMTSLSTGTTALPIAGDAPSVCLEDQRLDDGYVQPLLFHQSDLAKKTASLQMLLAESSSSSDDEDSIYEEISTGALKHISHDIPPLLIECMVLQVSQLRDLVESNKGDLLESDPYDCPVLNVTFLLEVNPSDSRSISARLYLLSNLGMHMKSGHLNDKYFLVELRVSQSKDKKVPKQGASNLYSISKAMETLDSLQVDSTHSERPTAADTKMMGHKKGVCVASFPSIISHANLMDRNLVTRPYLILTFTFRHHQIL